MSSKNNIIIHSTIEDGYDFFIIDNWKKKYHFKIATFSVPTGLLSEAIEVIKPNTKNIPRKFHLLSDFEDDIEKSEMLLKARIKKGINRKHLIHENGKIRIGNEQQLRGRIEWNNNLSDTQFENVLVIDGKRITIEKFSEMIECYESWNFKFRIYDSTDELD